MSEPEEVCAASSGSRAQCDRECHNDNIARSSLTKVGAEKTQKVLIDATRKKLGRQEKQTTALQVQYENQK